MSEDLILNHEEWVQRYRQHFELNISEICQISPRVLKKILFVVILESLAKARHPEVDGARDRFLCLLGTSSNWDDRNRVSLPQLLLRLEKDEQYKSSPLAQRIRGELQGWQWSLVYPMRGRDPSAEEVKKWNEVRELGKPIAKLIDQVEHSKLLYDYRNNLVHEFREPSSGIEATDHDYPYYFSLTSDGERIWDLIYPVGFFHRLVIDVLENVCTYFVQQGIDPYGAYDWGPTWRPR